MTGGYGARELPTSSYPERTFANARDSDATLWFGDVSTPMARATIGARAGAGKPCLRVEIGFTRPLDIARRIMEDKFRVLNVADPSESKMPGIGVKTERFLADVFSMAHRPEVARCGTWRRITPCPARDFYPTPFRR